MEKRKNTLLKILIGIIILMGIIIILIGIKCGEHAHSVTPVFNGSGFEYGTEKYDLPMYIALAA